MSGAELATTANIYLQAKTVIDNHSKYIDGEVLNALLEMPRIALTSESDTQNAITMFTQKLAGHDVKFEAFFDENNNEYRIKIVRIIHGNHVVSTLDSYFINSSDYNKIVRAAETTAQYLAQELVVTRGDNSKSVTSFGEGLSWLMQEVKKGLSIQRYKGLGEMNASQLWETTMNPNVRSLLKVTIEDAIGADNVFSTLMGDEVKPRRAFIESNALFARNLDV